MVPARDDFRRYSNPRARQSEASERQSKTAGIYQHGGFDKGSIFEADNATRIFNVSPKDCWSLKSVSALFAGLDWRIYSVTFFDHWCFANVAMVQPGHIETAK